MKILIYALLGLLLISCSQVIDPKLGEEFDLEYGQTAEIQDEDISIKFLNVLEDSRCPIGVRCDWMGNAEIALLIFQETLSVNTTLEPKEVDYDGYTVELISVSPYPVIDQEILAEDYIIRLVVTK